MGNYQTFRGNPENKLFYLLDQLVGGINTDFSDDVSPDNEFKSIINFNMDKRGSLYKRMGFGKLTAVSEILNLYADLPIVKGKTPEDPYPEETNDNIVYMKLLRNDNNCFRNLSAFVGEKAYRDYQKLYGSQNNTFELLIITTSKHNNTSTAWLYKCTLPELIYDENNQPTDEETIVVSNQVYDLPVLFSWDRTLCNIETIEYFDKIYFTGNNKGLVVFDRTNEEFSYSGYDIPEHPNQAYKPNAMEIRKVGFNLLGDDPLHWVDYQGLTTASIQGMYITTMEDKPALVIPSGGQFRLNVLYTGDNSAFNIEFKEGEVGLSPEITENADKSVNGLKVYDVQLKTVPTSEVEIKISYNNSEIDPYYDYYEVGQIDPEAKVVKNLNIGEYGVLEMYNRAVYYKDDTIWFSEINTFNYVPNYNYVSLPIEPTDKITKIVFFRNVYIIFTKFRIYKMVGSFGSTDFEVLPVNLSIGCHAPNTVVPVENELYFASKRGLYALKSSEFREGIENLKELDTKIKQLTADVTMYLKERSNPAVRYSGISDKAYAVRYKDKYMLFFNTAYEQSDFGEVLVDALVYQYELKAFSEIKFPIKPTFLFTVEGVIETFCTIKEQEEYTEEEVLLDYDFENLDQNTTVVSDRSGNGLDANLMDNVVVAPGTGLVLNGSSIKIGAINKSINLESGFTVEMDAHINALNGAKLLSLKQSISTGYSKSDTFSIYTSWSNGYRGELICTTTPNQNELTNQVSWKFRWHRDSTSRNASRSGKFSLKVGDTVLIPETSFNFNLGSSLYQDVASGTFTVAHDSTGNYAAKWKLTTSSEYPTYSTGWDKGATTYFDVTQFDSWTKYYGLNISGRAEAYNGGAKVTYTPAFYLNKVAAIYIGSKNYYVTVNGTQYTHTLPAISQGASSSDSYFYCSSNSVNINYTGSKSIFIDAMLKIKMDYNGVNKQELNIAGFYVNLPSVNQYTITTWNAFSMSGETDVALSRILKPSFREIVISIGNETDDITVYTTSEYNSSTSKTASNIGIVGHHKWKFVFSRTTSDYAVEVYKDETLVDTLHLGLDTIVNGDRDVNYILEGLDGTAYSFNMYTSDGEGLVGYTFTEGKGTNLVDTTGHDRTGVISDTAEWLTEKGLSFNGKNGYVSIPRLDEVNFSNGFIIEFEAKLNDINQNSKFFDFAMSYDSGESSNGKSSINAGTVANTNRIDFMTTSIDYKTYKISKTNADLTTRAKWKIVCRDTGSDYELTMYRNDEEVVKNNFNYGGITNITRKSNFIGKSNNPNDSLFDGMIYNFKVTINASANPVPIFVGSMYEYDTTYDDFGRAMEVEIETKGINLKYPLHTKKLKNIIVKGLGGYNYGSFFFEVYSDGHLVNNPRQYKCYIDEVTQQVVYDYEDVKELAFNEMMSLLGNMRLSYTKLGTSSYETRKMVVPAKGKNFTIKLYGESKDFLSVESFGFIFKLGKVKES